jgi:uncharacterized protein (TIGR02271 family)
MERESNPTSKTERTAQRRAYEPAIADPSRTGELIAPTGEAPDEPTSQTAELREEELVAQKDRVPLGEVVIRTEVEEVPSQVDAEVTYDEVVVEHIPVGEFVNERLEPWEEDGARVLPVYEEQLVLVKRLLLKEKVRIRRVPVSVTRTLEGTVRREQVVVEKPDNVRVREQVVNAASPPREGRDGRPDDESRETPRQEGVFEKVVRKVFF